MKSQVKSIEASTWADHRHVVLFGMLAFVILFATPVLFAEKASVTQMNQVAANWLTYMVSQTGDWAGSDSPQIIATDELRSGDTVLARVYSVEPRGFVLVPVMKELAPVKVYSLTSGLDVNQTQGFTQLLRENLSYQMQLFIQNYGGIDAVQPARGEAIFARDERQQWDRFAVDEKTFATDLSKSPRSPQEEVGPLLTSAWHQNYPYNMLCPTGYSGKCKVGCMATTMAQIMNFWKWPPAGTGTHSYYWNGDYGTGGCQATTGQTLSADYTDTYDWANMLDSVTASSSTAAKNAVAELSYEAGVAVSMMYGSCLSAAYSNEPPAALVSHFKYPNTIVSYARNSYNVTSWFNLIKAEIDAGRPIYFQITSHAMVIDGWKNTGGTNRYHLNYGWESGYSTAWYAIDNYFCSWGCSPADENIYAHIQPNPDWDGDGIPNVSDNCPLISNPTQTDADIDGLGDACDNCPAVANANQQNSDGDALGDACDNCPADSLNDVDGDGVCGNVDNCPTVANPLQTNTDADGIGDACDNCPNTYNPDQADSDADGIGNACDPDFRIVQTPDTADVFYIKQADIDGDNRTDVIYTGNTADSLYIAYGKADGTLETPRNYLKVTKAALAVDFVNGDSLLDIVAHTAGKVYVLLNLGNRDFSINSQDVSPSSWGYGSDRSSVFPSIATGYFNNDAQLDMVASENEILLGDGSGYFPDSKTLPFPFDAVGVSDFDRDGIDDIVVTANDSAFIFLNDGSANMSRFTALRIGYRTHDFTSVVTGMDLNGDGKTDFVTVTGNAVGTNDTSVVTIALGDGSGGITSSDTLRIVGTALNLALADVDKDGDLDISLVNATTRLLLITLNDGSGNFAPPVSISLGSGASPLYALISADVDRNGAPDFVIGGQDGNSILLAVSDIPDDPILPDEMVTTGYNNVTLRVENPLGLVISRPLSTVAGSAYWRMDADKNGVLDESAYDYNLQYGEYRIVIRPKSNVGSGPLCSVGIRIDGTAERTIYASYSSAARNLDSDSLVFYFQVEPVSSICPANGYPTPNPQPTFNWSRLGLAADSYQFQLDRYYDFPSPIFDTTGLISPQYHIPYSLGVDSVFYWRIRPFTGATPGNYSRTFAAYLLNYLSYLYGDANGDVAVDISDAVYLIAYIFSGGSAPSPLLAGDANCDNAVDISDVVYLIAYIFSGGSAPCAGCK